MNAALKTAIDLDVFSKLYDEPKTISSVAESVGADSALVSRLFRFLSAMGVITMDDNHLFALTKLSSALVSTPHLSNGVRHLYDVVQPVYLQFPNFLRDFEYRNPSPDAFPWQSAANTNMTYFQWLENHPKVAATFHSVMAGYSSSRPRWPAIYPKERLLHLVESSAKTSPLFVDIGGGMGQDIESFRQLYDKTHGLHLQDLPEVIKEAHNRGLNSCINATPHDFFKEQPIHEARIYFIHAVLHNWPDQQALKILKNIKSAMKPGVSRLFINEAVMRDHGTHPLCASADLLMMSLFGAKERDENDWQTLLFDAGLSIIHIWSIPEIPESLIEAEVSANQ